MKGYGKNGNKLVGRTAHPVACYSNDGFCIEKFKSLREAGKWCVSEGKASSVESASVAITHVMNGKQHYYGKDHNCHSAYGLIWQSLRNN